MNDIDTFTIKLPMNVGNLGKLIVADSFEWLPKVQKIAQTGHTAHILQHGTPPPPGAMPCLLQE